MEDESLSQVKTEEAPKAPCNICGEEFSNYHDLIKHKLTHD